MNLQEIRDKYPQYGDMSDEDLARGLHQKFYSDLPFDDFSQKIGFTPKPETTQAPQEGPVQVGEDAPDLTRGFANTLGNLQSTYGAAKVLAGKALDSKDMMQSGLEHMKAGEARTEVKPTDEFSEAWNKGIGSVVGDWLPYQIGSGAGNILETLGMMGIGAAAGAVTGAGVGALPGAVGSAIEKTLVEKGIKDAAAKILEAQGKKAAEKFTADYAAKALSDLELKTAARSAAKSIGGNLGLVTQAAGHGMGEVTQQAVDQAQKEGRDPTDIDMSRVVPAAIVHGVADYFTEKIGLHALDGLAENASKSMIADIAKAIAVTGTKEAVPETIQEIAQRYGANMSLTDADALKDYVNTIAASYAMSVAPAGIGGVRSHMAGNIPTAKPDDAGQQGAENAKQMAQTVEPALQDPLLKSTVDEDGNPIGDTTQTIVSKEGEQDVTQPSAISQPDRTGAQVSGEQQAATTSGGTTIPGPGGLAAAQTTAGVTQTGKGTEQAPLDEKTKAALEKQAAEAEVPPDLSVAALQKKAGIEPKTKKGKATTTATTSDYLNTPSYYGAVSPAQSATETNEDPVDRGIHYAGHEMAFDTFDTVAFQKGVEPELKRIAAEKNKVQQAKRNQMRQELSGKIDEETGKPYSKTRVDSIIANSNIPLYKAGAPLDFLSPSELTDIYLKHAEQKPIDNAKRQEHADRRNAFLETLDPLQRAKANIIARKALEEEIVSTTTKKQKTTDADSRKGRQERVSKTAEELSQELQAIAKEDVAKREAQVKETAEKEQAEAAEEKATLEAPLQKEKEAKAKKAAPTEKVVPKRTQAITQAIKDKSLSGLLKAVGGVRKGSDPLSIVIGNQFNNLIYGIEDPSSKKPPKPRFTIQTKVQFGEVTKGDGQYDPATNTITIKGNDKDGYTGTRPLAEVALHEVSHATLDHVFDNPEKFFQSLPADQRKEARAALNRLGQNYRTVKAALGHKYKINTIKEFAAEYWSNPKFQVDLAMMESKSTYAPKDNLFMLIARNIANVLGISSKNSGVTFKEIAEDLARLISVPNPETGMVGKQISYSDTIEAKLRDDGNIMPGEKSDYSVPEEHQPKSFRYFKELFFTRPGWRRIATAVQNERYEIKHWQDVMDMAGKIYYEGKDKINNIYGQLTLATGRAKNLFNSMVEGSYEGLDQSIYNLSKAAGVDIPTTLDMMHRILEGLHESERRAVKYLMVVPLSPKQVLPQNGQMISPADRRNQIFNLLDTKNLTEVQAKALRKELDAIVKKYADPLGDSPYQAVNEKGKRLGVSTDINAETYNVTGITSQAAAERVRQYENSPHKRQIDEVIKYIKQLHHTTTELNKMANYWSQPVSNRVAFYGFENYVPLEGIDKHNKEDEMLDFDSERMGRELQDVAYSFDGRLSVSNNPVLQTMSNATRAAMRAGRKDLTQSIKNAIDQKILAGRVFKHITFEERRDKDVLRELPRENTVFHYNEDGSIDVLEINDKKYREAIRRTYRNTNPLIDVANKFTSGLGMLHTRYNYNFAPLNFVRDTLTNAWAIGAEMGPLESAKFIAQISARVVGQNGMGKAMRMAALYEGKNYNQIKALAASGDPVYKDMYDFIEHGGMVNYVQGISLKSNFQQLQKEIGRSGIMRNAAQLNKMLDIWTDMFELTSRSAAFGIAKQNFMQQGMSEEAATNKAAEYAKNLANFEQVGQHGKTLGAIFMFFRPSATGAVRAIEAAAPAFQKVDKVMRSLPANLSDQERAKFKANFLARQKSARYMLTALAGMGALAYTMSMMMGGDDDLGRNQVMTDDPSQWTRFARFFTPFSKNPIQLPWGFGLGSFAALGAQLAMVGTGHQSFGSAMGNVVTQISLDSFVPIPVSRMPVQDDPALWMLDSLTPSLLRPAMEFVVNKNGLGQNIYNDSNRRMGDAYLGGDNIPQLYKDIARNLFNSTSGAIDWSPNSIYFLANSYMDGPARVIESATNGMYLAAGQAEEKDSLGRLKGAPLVGSFIGAAPNVDSREFSSIEKQIKEKEKIYSQAQLNPEVQGSYLEKYPLDPMLIDLYNKQVQGLLKDLRHQANLVRLMQDASPKERAGMLKEINQQENLVKYNLVQQFKAYGMKP